MRRILDFGSAHAQGRASARGMTDAELAECAKPDGFGHCLIEPQPDPSAEVEGASPSAASATMAAAAQTAADAGWQRPLGWLRRAGQFFFALTFSSLTRRIVSLNLAGLIALVAGILYLSQFRAGLIDARAQSLLVQAEIIAGAIAASAHRRDQRHHHRSGPAARSEARRNLRRSRRIFRARFSDQSRARRAGAAAADLADQDPRAHLRPRRRAASRQPQPLWPWRRAALRTCRRRQPTSRASPSAR